MQLEDYFDFLSAEDIRLKGHRIGIDDILDLYLEAIRPKRLSCIMAPFSQWRSTPPSPITTRTAPRWMLCLHGCEHGATSTGMNWQNANHRR